MKLSLSRFESGVSLFWVHDTLWAAVFHVTKLSRSFLLFFKYHLWLRKHYICSGRILPIIHIWWLQVNWGLGWPIPSLLILHAHYGVLLGDLWESLSGTSESLHLRCDGLLVLTVQDLHQVLIWVLLILLVLVEIFINESTAISTKKLVLLVQPEVLLESLLSVEVHRLIKLWNGDPLVIPSILDELVDVLQLLNILIGNVMICKCHDLKD